MLPLLLVKLLEGEVGEQGGPDEEEAVHARESVLYHLATHLDSIMALLIVMTHTETMWGGGQCGLHENYNIFEPKKPCCPRQDPEDRSSLHCCQ